MSNVTKNFQQKAKRGLGSIKGPKAAGDNIPVKVSAGEAILPKKTVRALGGSAGVHKLIKSTTGKAPKGLRAGGHYVDGSDGSVAARQAAAFDETQRINTRVANAAQDFRSAPKMAEVYERQEIAMRQAAKTAQDTAKVAADFRARPAPAIDQFGIPAGRSIPASPVAAGIDYTPTSVPSAAPKTSGLSLMPKDSIPYSPVNTTPPPTAPNLKLAPQIPAGMKTMQDLPTQTRLQMAGLAQPPAAPAPAAAPTAAAPAPTPAAVAQPMATNEQLGLSKPAPAATPAATPAEQPGMFKRGLNWAANKVGYTPTGGTAAPATTPEATAARPTLHENPQQWGKNLAADLKAGNIPGEAKFRANLGSNATSRLGAAGAALQFGDHWDAYSDEGGLSNIERAQLFLRDAGVLGGATVLGTAGAGLGSVVPVAGTIAGGVGGAVVGGTAVDRAMGDVRTLANTVNGALGGDPNYWKSSEELIAKAGENRKRAGLADSTIQRSAQGINNAIGKALAAVGIGNDAAQRAPAAAPAAQRAPAAPAAQAAQPAAAPRQPLVDADGNEIVGFAGPVYQSPGRPDWEAALRPQGTSAATAAPALPQGALAKSDGELRRSLRNGSLKINDFQSGTGAMVTGSGEVTRFDGRAQQAAEAAAAAKAAPAKRGLNSSQEVLAEANALMQSGNADDRVRANKMLRHVYPAMLQAETGRYQSDNTRASSRAQLQLEMRNKRGEAVMKQIENIYGPTLDKDGKQRPERVKFEDNLRRTIAEADKGGYGFDLADLSPQDIMKFQIDFDAAGRIEPSTIEKVYMNWVKNRPYVEDHNPARQLARAAGDKGKTDAMGTYTNANGWDVSERRAVNKQWITGSYDRNADDLLNPKNKE